MNQPVPPPGDSLGDFIRDAMRDHDAGLSVEPEQVTKMMDGQKREAALGALPGHEVAGLLGRGGMGSVYRARQGALERDVAVKVMTSEADSPEMTERFRREALVLGKLAHPNIVPVYDIGTDEHGHVFYTMKLVQGITLSKVLELLRSGVAATAQKYPLPTLLTIFQKVCDAMAFAHSHGILHRDLKPENVMIGEFGEVLLMDWGLAKVKAETGERKPERSSAAEDLSDLRSPFSALQTLQGSVMGTPQYMSPEQARGDIDALDERSDIFSLGGILYAILTLRPPVEGATLEEVLKKVSSAHITPPSDLRTGSSAKGAAVKKGDVLEAKLIRPLPHVDGGKVPAALSAVAMKALRLEPAQRYQSVAEFSADIEKFQGGFATTAENAGAWTQLALLIKRHKAAALGLAAVVVVGGVFGTKAILEGRRAEREAAAAKATLADLRRTAPVFATQAQNDLDAGKSDEAIEKIGYAIELDGANADYHLFRANLQQSAQNLSAAADDYRRALALRPADEPAKLNLALCEKLLRESGGGKLARDQQLQLLAALRAQKRLVESAPLAALLDPDIEVAKAALIARLREYEKQPGWTRDSVKALPDGTFEVRLFDFAIGDLSVLQGQPVSVLKLDRSNLTDLSSLAGLPLKTLALNRTKVADLSPLRGMPLEDLEISETLVTDLSPLRGMKLRRLNITKTGVIDLGPLAGMPLTELDATDCKNIRDLSPLQGASLRNLKIRGARITSLAPVASASLEVMALNDVQVTDLTPLNRCVNLTNLHFERVPVADLTPLAGLRLERFGCPSTNVSDLTPLRGQPLTFLDFRTPRIRDLSPLADCPTLEEIILPEQPLDLTPLRQLPKLRQLSTRSVGTGTVARPAQTAEEFWKEYDAKAK